MKITNDGPEEKSQPFAEMFRLQNEFQSKLSDETLRYLRRLQGSAAPVSPGTIVIPKNDSALSVAGMQGGEAGFEFEIENLQRVHCSVAPTLSFLVSSDGTTWFPQSEITPLCLLIPPNSTVQVHLKILIPQQLPDGCYNGCIMLQGFQKGALPLSVNVGKPHTEKQSERKTKKRSSQRTQQRKRNHE